MGLQTVNLKDSKGLEGLIVGICLGGLATTAVVLRLLSRRMMKVQLGADDYMIIVALVGVSQAFGYGRDANRLKFRSLPMHVLFLTYSVSEQTLPSFTRLLNRYRCYLWSYWYTHRAR